MSRNEQCAGCHGQWPPLNVCHWRKVDGDKLAARWIVVELSASVNCKTVVQLVAVNRNPEGQSEAMDLFGCHVPLVLRGSRFSKTVLDPMLLVACPGPLTNRESLQEGALGFREPFC